MLLCYYATIFLNAPPSIRKQAARTLTALLRLEPDSAAARQARHTSLLDYTSALHCTTILQY